MPKKPESSVKLRRAALSDDDRTMLLWAQENHVPGREPYASMSKEDILALMYDEKKPVDDSRFVFLEQYWFDKLSPLETAKLERTTKLADFLIAEFHAYGTETASYFNHVATQIVTGIYGHLELEDETSKAG